MAAFPKRFGTYCKVTEVRSVTYKNPRHYSLLSPSDVSVPRDRVAFQPKKGGLATRGGVPEAIRCPDVKVTQVVSVT